MMGHGRQNTVMRRRHGFSLIELLAVIAIIGLLIGLSFTMLNQMRNQARRAQAASQVTQIATAWEAYLQDHHAFPTGPPLTAMNAAAIGILRGSNAQQRVYLDFRGTTTEYLDPWGRPYRFTLDYGRSNRVPDPRGGPALYQSVIVWSWGPSGAPGPDGDEGGSLDDIVASTR